MASTETDEKATLKGEDISPEKDGGLFENLLNINSIVFIFSKVFSKK